MVENRLDAVGDDARDGVLLVNLGTPDAPTPRAIRRYLKEFLSDPRVVDVEPLLWWPILNGVILNLRPRRLVAKYRAIWTDAGGPLLATGRAQAAGLAQRLLECLGRPMPVALAMRYGAPAIETALAELDTVGVRRVVVLPLFPQYSASTSASVFDAVFAVLSRRRAQPALVTVADYHDDAGYIAALADSIEAHWHAQGRGEHLLMSFHGIPQRYADLGDPYVAQCRTTAALLAAKLGLADGSWGLTFQSRFGREAWVEPYTDEQLQRLAERGLRTLDVVAPGFPADCLETLEEIAVEYRDDFAALGGSLRYVPALNAGAGHLDALARIVVRAIGTSA